MVARERGGCEAKYKVVVGLSVCVSKRWLNVGVTLFAAINDASGESRKLTADQKSTEFAARCRHDCKQRWWKAQEVWRSEVESEAMNLKI